MNNEVQFVTDEIGNKTAVILDIADYERIIEDVQDLASVAERRSEPSIPHDEFIAGLKEDGILLSGSNPLRRI